MFRILIVDEDVNTQKMIEGLLEQLPLRISVLYADTVSEANRCLSLFDIDFFIIDLSKNTKACYQLASSIRAKEKYVFTPIIVLADKLDHIITAFREIRCLDYILKPVCASKFANFITLVVKMSNYSFKYNKFVKNCIPFNTSHTLIRLPVEEILFIESSDHKCIVHTWDEEICIPMTIRKLLDKTKNTSLIQTHRSFIINTENIYKIIKDTEPWVVYFDRYAKTALVSRAYKKIVEENLLQ